MFSSTIIPTIGRATLARAVESVLDQAFSADSFEVVVVNDSGAPLPAAPWQTSPHVRVVTTQRRERSTARNTGAALARGRYLHFLDDDDWLLPGALQAIYDAAQATKAGFLYGQTQLVDRRGQPMFTLRHGLTGEAFIAVMSGEWIPLQSSFVRAERFFAAGGFHSWMLATEDIDLTRRLMFSGMVVEVPHPVSAVGRGQETSSSHLELQSHFSRLGREMVLNRPGALAALRRSAGNSYWQGRILYIYLTSALWNLQHRKFFQALSRLLFADIALLLAGRHLLAPDYWRAVMRPFKSFTFLRAEQRARVEQRSAAG